MKHTTIIAALASCLILTTTALMAADSNDFEAREYRDADGNVLLYRVFKPAGYDPAKKYPLVLFLHGAGERGSNNLAQVRDARYFAKEDVQKDNPCFVVAPQCPMNRPAFQLYGTGKDFDTTYADYEKSRGQWKSYRIVLSKLPTGAKTHLMFLSIRGRRPAAPSGAAGGVPEDGKFVSEFRNIRIAEDGAAAKPIDLSKLSWDKKAGSGQIAVSADGLTVTATGDVRVKVPFDCTVTKSTILEVEFRAETQGQAHAIGLDVDEQFDYRWVQRDWGGKTHAMPKSPSIPMKLAIEAVEKLQKEFSIDASRLYLTGLSMGGYGTWDLLARQPTAWAAGIPVCGGGDEATAPIIKDIPIWCFHGGADTVVKTERSRNMIEAIKKAGGQPKYTEYPGVGHNSWDRAYSDEEMLKWMFEQKRK